MTQEKDNVTLDEVMARRFELDETIAIIQGRHKAELEPHQDELNLCESFVKDEMNKLGTDQYKQQVTGHMAYFTTKDKATVQDWNGVLGVIVSAPPFDGFTPEEWELIMQHVRTHGEWGLLNQAVNKTNVKEFIKVHGAPPPGVKYDTFRDLNWRRGKGNA